jgi:hypothetical protein
MSGVPPDAWDDAGPLPGIQIQKEYVNDDDVTRIQESKSPSPKSVGPRTQHHCQAQGASCTMTTLNTHHDYFNQGNITIICISLFHEIILGSITLQNATLCLITKVCFKITGA